MGLSSENKVILRKIIYAVETGGQIYGNARYDAFTPAGTNSPNETGVTLGAGQWHGANAKKLLNRIKEAAPAVFEALDTAGIVADLSNYDWSSYKIVAGTAKAKCIQAIISSDAGKAVQDALLDEELAGYVETAKDLYVLNAGGQMMSANIIHLGGSSALKRVLAKTVQPYTNETIYAALCTDNVYNQVGAEPYKSRQQKVYGWIKEKVQEEETMSKTEQAIRWMEDLANNDLHGYDQVYRWGQKGDYDCSSAVITAWEQAGVPVKSKGATYTGNMRSIFLSCGFKDVTSSVNMTTGVGLERGDVLLNTVKHVAMHCGDGKEVEASINEKGGITGGTPGDQTGKEILIRAYRNYPWTHVLRFAEDAETEPWKATGTATSTKDGTKILVSAGGNSVGTLNKGNRFEIDGTKSGNYVRVKVANIGIGYIHKDYVVYDGVSGSTPAAAASVKSDDWIKRLQVAIGANQDGIAGPETLGKCPLVKNGSSGSVTRLLQEKLIALGYSCGNAGADGICGSGTVAAIKAYQKAKGLTVDGIAGKNTWSKLLGLS